MQSIFFDPAGRGFYAEDRGDVPAGAVKISAGRHRQLLDGQAEGAQIVAGADGTPRLRWPSTSIESRRAAAVGSARYEARKRILAIAPVHVQANDAAVMAQAALQIALEGVTTIDFAPAIERRRAIDALRTSCDALETAIGAASAEELDALHPADDRHWERPQ